MDPDTSMSPLTLGRRLWAIRRDVLSRLNTAHRLANLPALTRLAEQLADSEPQVASLQSARSRNRTAGGQVAVIPLTGVLTPRGSFLSYIFGGGGGGLQAFRAEFREALASPDVGAIVLDVDSPGGLVDLVPETATEIREARGDKPIIAVANTMAASGAYWIGAQADEFVVTPSGDVGSIGVYVVHEDWSGWNEQEGIVPTYISAGKYKTEGNMDEPLSDEAREHFQEEVDDLYTMFVDAVAEGREVTAAAVRSGYGEGRTLLAARALEAGMVDRVATIEDVVGELLGGGNGSPTARATRTAPRPRAEVPGDEPPAEEPAAPVEPPVTAPEPAVPVEPDPEPVVPEDAPIEEPAEHPEPVQPVEPAEGADEELDDEPDPEGQAAIAAVLTS